MKTSLRKIVIPLISAAALLAYVGTSQADGRFSARTIRGVYGFSGSGTLAGGAIQAAVAGLNSFDGADGCTVTARLNAGGTVHSVRSTSCSYTVNSDGTGSAHITLTGTPFPLPEFRSDFVIVDNAKEIHFVLSDAAGGTVASGVAKRQVGSER
jgi:hypothetical protein